MAGEARATTLGAYVEIDPANAVRVTTLGAYVELVPGGKDKQKKGKPPKPPKKPKKPSPATRYRSVFSALTAWYPAVSSAGSTILRDMVGNNDAPMQGTVPWLSLDAWGHTADLPGVAANYFDAGASTVLCDTDMSIACWVRFDSVPTTTDDRHYIVGRKDVGADAYGLGVRCPNAGWPAYVFWELGGTLVFTGQYEPISAGEVYHIVVTGSGGKAPGEWDLYIDGDLVETSVYSGAIPFENTDTFIGRAEEAGSEGPMDGQLIDLQIYGRPLSPAEVRYLFDPLTRWGREAEDEAWVPFEFPILMGPLGKLYPGLSGLSAMSGLGPIMGKRAPIGDSLLKEDDDYLLLEGDDFLLLE